MRTLIIGLGNPIMGDDAIGCNCAREIKKSLETRGIVGVEVEQFYRGGISLMERLIGYDRALLIDSITGFAKDPGDIIELQVDDLPSSTTNSPHDSTLKDALQLGSQLGEKLPSKIDILAIEISPRFEFTEQLTPPVAACIPRITQLAVDWVIAEE
jgi:hydrogenase maturation protease